MGRNKFALGLNTLGYLSLLAQSVWLLIQFMPTLINSETISDLDAFNAPRDLPVAQIPDQLLPGATMFSAFAIALVLLATIYVLIKSPPKLAKRAESSVHESSQHITPKLIKTHQVTKKQRLVLTRRIQLTIKLSLALITFGLLWTVEVLQSPPLPLNIVLIIGGLLLVFSLLWFGLAYLLEGTPQNSSDNQKPS